MCGAVTAEPSVLDCEQQGAAQVMPADCQRVGCGSRLSLTPSHAIVYASICNTAQHVKVWMNVCAGSASYATLLEINNSTCGCFPALRCALQELLRPEGGVVRHAGQVHHQGLQVRRSKYDLAVWPYHQQEVMLWCCQRLATASWRRPRATAGVLLIDAMQKAPAAADCVIVQQQCTAEH